MMDQTAASGYQRGGIGLHNEADGKREGRVASDLTTLAELVQLQDSAQPGFLWSFDGQLLWANPAAAVFWGRHSPERLVELDWSRHPAVPHLRSLVRNLRPGQTRLERVALFPFGRTRPVTAKVSRLTLGGGERALLLVMGEAIEARKLLTLPTLLSPSLGAVSELAMPGAAKLADVVTPDTAIVTVNEIVPAPRGTEPDDVLIAQDRETATPPVGDVESNVADGEIALADAPVPTAPLFDVVAQDNVATTTTYKAEPPDLSVIEGTNGALEFTTSADTIAPALSPRAAAFMERGHAPLRFVWEADRNGVLTYVSRDFVVTIGAQAMPEAGESLAAFAKRTPILHHEALQAALGDHQAFSGLRLAWPVFEGGEHFDIELSAAPAEGGGFRGFGAVHGLIFLQHLNSGQSNTADSVAATLTDQLAAEPVASLQDQPASEPTTHVSTSAPPIEDKASTNVVSFPLPTAQSFNASNTSTERKLEPSESAALRTIARVLGGPIGLPRATPLSLETFLKSAPQPGEGKSPHADPPVPSAPMPPDASAPALPADAAKAEGLTEPLAHDTSADAPQELANSNNVRPPVGEVSIDQAATQLRQERLRQERLRENELRAILDTATDGIIILSAQGRVMSLNRSAEALFGVESEDIDGDPITRLLAPISHRIASDYLDGLTRNGVASVLNDGREVMGLEKNGGTIPLFMTLGRISSPEAGDKFCAVLRDITQWKTAEQNLLTAKKEAEDASHHKSDFLAKMSHEIRTPLNAIIGFAEVMMEERFGPMSNERYREYMGDIHSSGTHILGLVNDLLDLSKIEAGKVELHFSAVKLGDIVQQAVATMQPQANRLGVILRASVPKVPPVVADLRSLRQILFNLLSNAVKFTRSGGQVIVSTGTTPAGEVTLRVRDSGVGMTLSEIETALRPFGRIASASRLGEEGTGLGLPLTKALAEANRANFHIESLPDSGTVVQITFPSTRVLAE